MQKSILLHEKKIYVAIKSFIRKKYIAIESTGKKNVYRGQVFYKKKKYVEAKSSTGKKHVFW